jgi:hypothetical protein
MQQFSMHQTKIQITRFVCSIDKLKIQSLPEADPSFGGKIDN